MADTAALFPHRVALRRCSPRGDHLSRAPGRSWGGGHGCCAATRTTAFSCGPVQMRAVWSGARDLYHGRFLSPLPRCRHRPEASARKSTVGRGIGFAEGRRDRGGGGSHAGRPLPPQAPRMFLGTGTRCPAAGSVPVRARARRRRPRMQEVVRIPGRYCLFEFKARLFTEPCAAATRTRMLRASSTARP
jgi:hypothetical protein